MHKIIAPLKDNVIISQRNSKDSQFSIVLNGYIYTLQYHRFTVEDWSFEGLFKRVHERNSVEINARLF